MIEQFHDTNEPSTKRKTVHRLNDIGDVVVRVNIAEDVNSFSLQVCTITRLFRNLHQKPKHFECM